MQVLICYLAGEAQQTQLSRNSRLNIDWDEATTFSIPPFAKMPWAHKGGLLGNGDQVGHGKLQAAEHKKLASLLPHIVDALPASWKSWAVGPSQGVAKNTYG